MLKRTRSFLSTLFALILALCAIVPAHAESISPCPALINPSSPLCWISSLQNVSGGNFDLSVNGIDGWTSFVGNDISVVYSPYGPVIVRANQPATVSSLHRNIVANELAYNFSKVNLYLYTPWGNNQVPEKVFTRIAPTPIFTEFVGDCLIDGDSCPVGTIVEAFTPSGVLAGRSVVPVDGVLVYTRLYGTDADWGIVPPTPGFKNGEVIEIRINGISTDWAPFMTWADDPMGHTVTVNLWHPVINSIEIVGSNVWIHGKHLFPSATGEQVNQSQVWIQPEGRPVEKVINMTDPSSYADWEDDTIVFPRSSLPTGEGLYFSVLRGNGSKGTISGRYLFQLPKLYYFPLIISG